MKQQVIKIDSVLTTTALERLEQLQDNDKED